MGRPSPSRGRPPRHTRRWKRAARAGFPRRAIRPARRSRVRAVRRRMTWTGFRRGPGGRLAGRRRRERPVRKRPGGMEAGHGTALPAETEGILHRLEPVRTGLEAVEAGKAAAPEGSKGAYGDPRTDADGAGTGASVGQAARYREDILSGWPGAAAPRHHRP